MYCSCTRGMDAGYSAPDEGDVWVHAKCRLIPFYVFDRITHMRVPYGAKSVCSVVSTETGHNYVTFHMEDGTKTEVVYYHPYPFKDSPMTEQKDVLYKFWLDLDSVIDAIRMDTPVVDPDDMLAARTRASTLAEVLAYLMHRYYEDGTAVLKESMARWKARQEGVTDHQTPGLAEAIWAAGTRFDGTPYSGANLARVRSGGRSEPRTPTPTGNRIPDTAVESWKSGIEGGMFTVAQAANTYHMTEEEIKQQLGLV